MRLVHVAAAGAAAAVAAAAAAGGGTPDFVPDSATFYWWDTSDLTKAWQDTGATTPVTATGQNYRRVDCQIEGGPALLISGGQPGLLHSSGYLETPTAGTPPLVPVADGFSYNPPNCALWLGQKTTSLSKSIVSWRSSSTYGNELQLVSGGSHRYFNAGGGYSNVDFASNGVPNWVQNTDMAYLFQGDASGVLALRSGAGEHTPTDGRTTAGLSRMCFGGQYWNYSTGGDGWIHKRMAIIDAVLDADRRAAAIAWLSS